MLRILGSLLVGGLCWILYLKKNMRWDSLETSFFELVSILSFLNKKKRGFLSFGFKLEKLWFFPFRLFALAEMFEPTFGLGGAIFLSLMGPLEIFQKQKVKKKKNFSNFSLLDSN